MLDKPIATNTFAKRRRGFTLIELLVVIAIIGVLLGILLPSFFAVRRQAAKTVCGSNLRQLGVGIGAYLLDNKETFPAARHMPEPFWSTDDDPPLPLLLRQYMVSGWPNGGGEQHVFRCPGDQDQVYPLAKMCYQYEILIGGVSLNDFFPIKIWNIPPSEVWLARDFDGGVFDLTDNSQIEVPFFHARRNLLFADGHVGNFQFD